MAHEEPEVQAAIDALLRQELPDLPTPQAYGESQAGAPEDLREALLPAARAGAFGGCATRAEPDPAAALLARPDLHGPEVASEVVRWVEFLRPGLSGREPAKTDIEAAGLR